jgi:C4-dicarboxylate transporter DctM subunit
MSGIEFGLLAFVFLLVLLALRVHIAVAMLITGITGYVSMVGWAPLLAYLKNAAFARYSVYDLAVVPLFLLMGQFALRGGLSKGLFDAANAFVGHWRGGIAMGAVGACAGFGAICGSSLATAATMGQVALPELRRHGYSPGLATGALSAGGTLGVLIPPSVVLVIYAILTEQNIARLFLAALIPGILAAIGYMITIMIYVRLNPAAGPAGPKDVPLDGPAARAARRSGTCWLIFVDRDRRHLRRHLHADRGRRRSAHSPPASSPWRSWRPAAAAAGSPASTAPRPSTGDDLPRCMLGADLLNVFLALTQMPNGARPPASQRSGLPPLAVHVHHRRHATWSSAASWTACRCSC